MNKKAFTPIRRTFSNRAGFTPLEVNRHRRLPRLRRGLLTGFTVFELVVVLTIMVILATVAAAQFHTTEMLKLDAAVQKIVADIRYAQQLVMYSDALAFHSYGSPSIMDSACLVVDFCTHNAADPGCDSTVNSCCTPQDPDTDSYYITPCVVPRTGGCGGTSFTPTIVERASITDPFTGQPLEVHFSGPNAIKELAGVEISTVSLSTDSGFGLASTGLIFSQAPLVAVDTGYWSCDAWNSPYPAFFYDVTRNLDIPLPGGRSGGIITLTYKGRTKNIYIENRTGRIIID